MKWSRFIISLLMAAASQHVVADTIAAPTVVEQSRYEKHLQRYRDHWAALIPTDFIVQNAGNMGTLSAGIGWTYGRRQHWETDLLFGFIPKHQATRAKVTMTLKENYIPWTIHLKKGWNIEPFTTSLYLNTVFGHEFWERQPNRYPKGYYQFMSTKFRANIAIGQRATFIISDEKRRHNKSIAFFYELSTCDVYIRSKFLDNSVSLADIVGLSLGIRLQTN